MHDTILIVDDDESMRTFLSAMLQAAGYGVVLADSLQAGMRALEETPVDLLIADIRLGSANGLQLIALSRRFMPTIAITGFPDPVIEAQARQFGAMFLLKPFISESLLALVGKRLRPYATRALLGEKRAKARHRPSARQAINFFSAAIFTVSTTHPALCDRKRRIRMR